MPWTDGIHRTGVTLTLGQAIGLGRLLADLHHGLTAVLPPTPATVPVEVTEPAA